MGYEVVGSWAQDVGAAMAVATMDGRGGGSSVSRRSHAHDLESAPATSKRLWNVAGTCAQLGIGCAFTWQ